jgi:hypothetical protein
MKTDKYTKIILTIIAIVLIGIFLQNTSLIPPAFAKSVKGMSDDVDATIVSPTRSGAVKVYVINASVFRN